MYGSVGGQDHLGLGSVVTDKILPSLLPGINVLTPHPRYWSFYAFVLDEFWRRDLPRTNTSLRRFIRSKESIFSAAGHMCVHPEHTASPIGSRRVGPLVESSPTKYRTDFDYMKSSGGGYGLYYATTMQTTGVVRIADKSIGLPVDAVTPSVGAELAEAFRQSIVNTDYWRKYFDSDEVPANIVEEYGNVACLCRLRDNPPDRAPLVDIFLHGGHQHDAEARRRSLQLMLEIAHQSNGTSVLDEDFRRLLLYRSAFDPETDDETCIFAVTPQLNSVAIRWRLSQLREMFNWSLNGTWQWIHTWGLNQSADVSPVLMTGLDGKIDGANFRPIIGVSMKTNEGIARLVDLCHQQASMTDSLDNTWELGTDLTEDALLTNLQSDAYGFDDRLLALFVLYLMSLVRLIDPNLPHAVGAVDWSPVIQGGIARISTHVALDQLRNDIRDSKSIAEVMKRVVRDHVIAQHERVAMAKLPDDTFRFRREGIRLRCYPQPHSFQRNSSRFNSLSTVCTDLGWCGSLSQPNHPLSQEGHSIRELGDLPRGTAS